MNNFDSKDNQCQRTHQETNNIMHLLHTADWHIGQYFFGYDRKEEHLYFFDWLKKTIKKQQVDVLLIAGDVFDSPNPSAESQKIYYRFLREITSDNPDLQIIITAGNHDSAARLEAPSPLLEEMNIHVKGVIRKNMGGEVDYQNLFIPLTRNGKTEAWCIAVPYLRQGDYPNAENYARGVGEMYDILYDELQKAENSDLPVVMMGHLHAFGSEVSGNDRSERTVVGGLDCVPPEVFDKEKVVYTALGHLHKAQLVLNSRNVYYSGSPLPMSFAEKNYKQGVNLIKLKNNKLDEIEQIAFEPPVKLISLPEEPKPLDDVLAEIANLPDGDITFESPYLELKVLITEPEPSMRNQIEEALEKKSVRLTSAVPYKVRHNKESRIITCEELKTINPMEMAEDVFFNEYGDKMPDTMKSLLQSAIEEVSR